MREQLRIEKEHSLKLYSDFKQSECELKRALDINVISARYIPDELQVDFLNELPSRQPEWLH
jgi:hypothetical protein